MSMSTEVIGLRDMDGEFKRMIAAKKFCEENDLSYPEEVREYFDTDFSSAGDSESYLRDVMLEVKLGDALREWSDRDSSVGYEIDVSKLPPEVKTIRFYNSW